MSVLGKLDGSKSKRGLPSTNELIEMVKRRLEADWCFHSRMCIRRADIHQQKLSAIICIREITGAGLVDAKHWVEKHIKLPIDFGG